MDTGEDGMNGTAVPNIGLVLVVHIVTSTGQCRGWGAFEQPFNMQYTERSELLLCQTLHLPCAGQI